MTMNIIVVENDSLLSDALLQLFRSKACRVHAVSTAEEALQAMQTEHVDVIISDHSLPGLDGVTFLMHTRQSQPDAIRILLTNYPTSTPRGSGTRGQTCIDDVIVKPFTVSELERSLCRLLDTNAREGSIS